MKKIFKWILAYLGCCAVVEIMLALLFLLGQSMNGYGAWEFFGYAQLGAILVGGILLLIFVGLKDMEEQRQKEVEWHKRVNKMLNDYEKEKEEERMMKMLHYREDIENEIHKN